MSSLFNIGEEFQGIYELANELEYDENNELVDNSETLTQLFNELECNLTDKLDATNYIIKELKADEQTLKDEAKRLNEKAKVLSNKQDRLKELMKKAIELSGNSKLKGKFSYSLSERETYNYDGISMFALDHEFIRKKEEIDKTKIKEFVKAGGTIDGLKIEHTMQLSIR